MSSSKRNSLLLALASLGIAYLFFRADSFWGIVCSVLVAVWALITTLPVMDANWRFKVGFVVCVLMTTGLVLWPSADGMTEGKLKCPQYVRDRITFGIAPGLDLRGGMRLVYTVEVDEAIRDKRDNFANARRVGEARRQSYGDNARGLSNSPQV
jgi:preprotein translocase subunit SecD